MFNDTAKIDISFDSLASAGCLALQFGGNRCNHLFDIKSIANGRDNQDTSKYISVIALAIDSVQTVLEHRGGNEEDELREEFQGGQYLECMFHFDFVLKKVGFTFYENGFIRRIGDERVWNLDDGQLFSELQVKYPFDTDGHDQQDFFLDTRRWPLANIDWVFPYPDELMLPLQSDILPFVPNQNIFFNQYFRQKVDVNPRINTMIDSIDKMIGQRVLLAGETNASCHVQIDYSMRTIKFERTFYAPRSWEIKSGSLSFTNFGKLADSLTREECIVELGIGY